MTQTVAFFRPSLGEKEIAAVVESLRSGWLTTGPQTSAFEAEFGALMGNGAHAIAVNSATAALHLGLEALGVGPRDEVIVPTMTFTATAEVIRYLGATPVFVDMDPGKFHGRRRETCRGDYAPNQGANAGAFRRACL